MKIAIIGAGISGLLTARLLSEEHEIEVFEAESYAGGHTNTVSVDVFGKRYAVDTGFMVFNDHTYPNFIRMLEHLRVSSRLSDMSFGLRCDRTGLEYQGGSLSGLFSQRRNLFRPGFYRMLREILRFNRQSIRLVESGVLDPDLTLKEYLKEGRFGRQLIEWYLIPMGSAIWSASPECFLDFPARFLLGFFHNHGLLTVRGHFQWKTIDGGAIRYIEALTRPFTDRIRLKRPVIAVQRHADRVTITAKNAEPLDFDSVVMAAHADQSLEMLNDATQCEREILGAFPYQPNDTALHVDSAPLPKCRRAWASWNYRIPKEIGRPPVVTYNLNRLQGHVSPDPICVTLNGTEDLDPSKILRRFQYHHPAYSPRALAAQGRWHEINGVKRTYYCGAYWGNGFHEDGVNSALAVAKCFGKQLDQCKAASM